MIADDVLVTDAAESEETPLPAKQQNNEVGSFLDELTRSQSRKKLDLIGEIELYVKSLELQLKQRTDSFLQSDSTISFKEMALFQSIPLLAQDLEDHSMTVSEFDDLVVGCFVIENAASRSLLSAALTGKVPTSRDDNKLTSAECSLLLVFASLLNTALNESFEGSADLGVPKKATFVQADEFLELSEDEDWVCLTFEIAFCDVTERLMLLVPLSLLNGEHFENSNTTNTDEVVIDTKWQSALFDHIENIKVPLVVEFGTIELPLSQVENLKPGQAFEMQVDDTNLKVLTEHGQALMCGGLLCNGNKLELKITEKAA